MFPVDLNSNDQNGFYAPLNDEEYFSIIKINPVHPTGCRLFLWSVNFPIQPPEEIIHRLNVFLNVDLPGLKLKKNKKKFDE